MISKDDIAFLETMDTPTVCNVVEMVWPERRDHGYTTRHLHCCFPQIPQKVGFAKTLTCRSRNPGPHAGAGYLAHRLEILDYIAAAPNPSWMVIQDLDEPAGHGAYWGEVQSNVHKALGCHGVITNGSVRDIPQIPEGFQMLAGSVGPSHAHIHAVAFGQSVTVHGMAVSSGDLIHADQHGAVVVPLGRFKEMREALKDLTAREAKIIAAAKKKGATLEEIKAAIRG